MDQIVMPTKFTSCWPLRAHRPLRARETGALRNRKCHIGLSLTRQEISPFRQTGSKQANSRPDYLNQSFINWNYACPNYKLHYPIAFPSYRSFGVTNQGPGFRVHLEVFLELSIILKVPHQWMEFFSSILTELLSSFCSIRVNDSLELDIYFLHFAKYI